MELEGMVPLAIYDDRCYLCIRFAKFVNFLSGGRLLLVGHYSQLGEQLRNSILDSSALEMFWFVDGKTAFGGRAALFPLLQTIFSGKLDKNQRINVKESCDIGCKSAKAVFVRSASLITNSKKIPL